MTASLDWLSNQSKNELTDASFNSLHITKSSADIISSSDPNAALLVTGDTAVSGLLWARSVRSDSRYRVSDETVKNKGPLIETILSKLGNINIYRYQLYNDVHKHQMYGPMAQELQKILPDIVDTSSDILGVDYDSLCALNTVGIKELVCNVQRMFAGQQQEIADLKERVSSQTDRLREQADRLRELNDRLREQNDRIVEQNRRISELKRIFLHQLTPLA